MQQELDKLINKTFINYGERYDISLIKKGLYLNNYILPPDFIFYTKTDTDDVCTICYSNSTKELYQHDGCSIKWCHLCMQEYYNMRNKCCPLCLQVIIPENISINEHLIYAGFIKEKCFQCKSCASYVKKKGKRCSIICKNPSCLTKLCPAECGYMKHTLIPCEYMQQWYEELSSNDTYIKYIMQTSKKCPNCKIYITKNDDTTSCLKMKCCSCEFIFCWQCLMPYDSSHTDNFYKCNAAVSEIVIPQQDDITLDLWYKYNYTLKTFIAQPIHKYLDFLIKYIIYIRYTKGYINIYINKYMKIIDVLIHDFDGFRYKMPDICSIYKMLKPGTLDLIKYVPPPANTIILWDADYNHDNRFISYSMNLILNKSNLSVYYDIDDVELVTEHFYINFITMIIRSNDTTALFEYKLCRYTVAPWICPVCTMYNLPIAICKQECSMCLSLHDNNIPENLC